MEKLLYADDLALLAECTRRLESLLGEWKEEFERHGLRISVEKTEVMWIGEQHEDMEINLGGTRLKQVSSFTYLGGTVSENGSTDGELSRRVQSGANAWRKVEGVMADRRISKKLKGKVLSVCVVPALAYGLETVALTDAQHQKLQICKNNWVRRIAGVKRVEKRRLEELREEVGLSRTITDKVVGSRLKWAGQVVQMEEIRAPKRAFMIEESGRRRRGRPKMRWRERVAKDARAAGVPGEWTEVAKDWAMWRRLVKVMN